MPDSSTEIALPESEAAVSDVTSTPSTETKDQGVGTLLDAVNAALGEKPEVVPASDEPGPKEPALETKPEDKDEVSEEEMRRYSQQAQKRIRDLVDQRRAVEGEVAPLRQELETIKPKAEQMDHLLGYMQTHNVLPEHLDNALALVAMINGGKHEQALPVLESLLNQVRASAGEVLPPELQTKIDLGYITEADAKELHKRRLHATKTEQAEQQSRDRAQTERQQREVQAVVTQAVTAAEAWNTEQVAKDPEWNLKRDLVAQQMENEVARRLRDDGPAGYPRSPKEVRDLLDKAKVEVERRLKPFRPTPKAINPPATGGGVSPRSKAQPNSLMEAVNAALGE